MKLAQTISFPKCVRQFSYALGVCFFFVGSSSAQTIKLNQIGYSPKSTKVAIVPVQLSKQASKKTATAFQVIDSASNKVVFTGKLSKAKSWEYSGETVQQADFSELKAPGSYHLQLTDSVRSHPFVIAPRPLLSVHDAAAKSYYFNRAGMAISTQHGGKFSRKAGHPDTSVKVHKSAASKSRPKGTILASPKGWYDAGDYGKYVVNSGISTYTLLTAYRDYPKFYQGRDLAITESGDDVPDILDEIKWNLDWLETMQDLDGGVYHKLTALNFSAMTSTPNGENSQRYVIGKSTSATLNFAAVMANASRVMQAYEAQFPDLATQYKTKALKAYQWAKKHPKKIFKNPSSVATGEYGDKRLSDEFAWAAAELFLLTKDQAYFDDFKKQKIEASENLSWSSVDGLAFLSLSKDAKSLLSPEQYSTISESVIDAADQHLNTYQKSAYAVAISEPDFVWGSNGDVLNNGLMLVEAYRLSGEQHYLEAAMSTVDYVLGKNPTGYSYVTGYGGLTPMNIHHRPSSSDNVVDPVPGFLAGGPHTGRQDGCEYEGTHPATTYSDVECSYATNEIAINWNAPLVYMLATAVNLND